MLEAKLPQASLLKKIVESIRDIVDTTNFDCSSSGISLQAMDSSHVALVQLLLRSEGFESYRCDRSIPIGMNLASLSKILKSAANDDAMTIKASDSGDTINFIFESPNKERVSDYDMKLMSLDTEQLSVPETQFTSTLTMSAAEFQRICRDMGTLSESINVELNKEYVKFSASGEVGAGSVVLKPSASVDKEEATVLDVSSRVSLTLSAKYLNMFTKATPLSNSVTLGMADDVPVKVEYKIGDIGHIRFYLAPKIGGDE